MLRHNFCRPDGRLVKLFVFSTLLDKSPLTSIYFATFEKKREVRSPLSTQSFWFLVNFTFFDYMSVHVHYTLHTQHNIQFMCILYNLHIAYNQALKDNCVSAQWWFLLIKL